MMRDDMGKEKEDQRGKLYKVYKKNYTNFIQVIVCAVVCAQVIMAKAIKSPKLKPQN